MNLMSYKFILPKLPYKYSALEPYIDEETMYIHHDKHFKKYIDELNNSVSKYKKLYNWSLERFLKNLCLLPKDIQLSVKHNAGGVYNHNFYFKIMTPNSTGKPVGLLRERIIKTYCSLDDFKSELKNKALNQFGSGYAWLVCNNCGKLKIISTANQDCPISMNLKPILTVDIWEHAYYLKYKNRRDEYLDNWFNVINWELAEQIYKNYVNERR